MHFKTIAAGLLALFAFSGGHAQDHATKVGNATYYGDRWHGRRTADGSSYHKDSLTCAHRTLPFGTLLHVRNPKNGKVVIVKVTDRGPYRRNTIIDLSKAAAKQIDMVQAGVAKVELIQVEPYTGPLLPTEENTPKIPDFQLVDPTTGKAYTMLEWEQRENNRRAMAKANTARKRRHFMAKAKQLRYRVLSHRNTAFARKH